MIETLPGGRLIREYDRPDLWIKMIQGSDVSVRDWCVDRGILYQYVYLDNHNKKSGEGMFYLMAGGRWCYASSFWDRENKMLRLNLIDGRDFTEWSIFPVGLGHVGLIFEMSFADDVVRYLSGRVDVSVEMVGRHNPELFIRRSVKFKKYKYEIKRRDR